MKKKVAITVILSLFLSFFFIAYNPVKGQVSADNVLVNFQLTDNGVPLIGKKLASFNYVKAYDKISKGQYTDADKESVQWTNLHNQFPDGEDGIKLPDGYLLKNGVQNSRTATLSILRYLFSNGHVDLLQVLNESTQQGVSSSNTTNNEVQAGSFTNNSGRSNFTIPTGATIFADVSNNQFYKIQYITKAEDNLQVDISNTDDRLEVTSNFSKAQRGGHRQYSADYGQELTYQIKVDKEFFERGAGSITITPTSNLVVDEISLPAQEESTVPDVVNPNAYLNIPEIRRAGVTPVIPTPWKEVTEDNRGLLADTIGQALLSQSISSYHVDIPQTADDIEITVKAHIEPRISLDRTLAINQDKADAMINIDSSNSPSSNFLLNVKADNSFEDISAQSVAVNTSGINFVQTKNNASEFAQAKQYVLVKEDAGSHYFYSNDGWKKSSSQPSISDLTLLTGGNRYYIGSLGESKIPFKALRFGLGEEEAHKINQSLIQIRGLAQGNYYLQEVDHKRLTDNKVEFRCYTKNVIGPNGQVLVKNTISYAEKPAYDLSAQIPDYNADANEYNVLPENASSIGQISPLRVVIPLIVLVLILLVIGIVLSIIF